MKKQLRKDILTNLQNKKIVIFGAGIMAHEFYEMYQDQLDFAFCVTNDSKEWGEKRFCQALDVKQYSQQQMKGKYYIVVCISLAFDSVASQLVCDDYTVFQDFVDYKVAEAVLERKKLAFFYGTCILRDTYYLLERVPAFTEEYVGVFTQTHAKKTILDIQRLYYGKELCDAYVYARKLMDVGEAYYMQKKDLPPDCIMIGVSNVTFHGYWPQALQNLEYNEHWLFDVMAPFDTYFWHLMYAREDVNITRLVQEGKSPQQVYQIVSAEDFYSEKEIRKHLRVCFKTLEMAERGLEVTVGDFIKDNYQKERLYQDFTHLRKSVLWEYAKRILDHLEVKEKDLAQIIAAAPEYVHRGSDTPIYPSVARALGLEWVDENTRYEVLTGKGVQLMTFQQYVLHYAEYMQKALEIEKGW